MGAVNITQFQSHSHTNCKNLKKFSYNLGLTYVKSTEEVQVGTKTGRTHTHDSHQSQFIFLFHARQRARGPPMTPQLYTKKEAQRQIKTKRLRSRPPYDSLYTPVMKPTSTIP